MILSLSVHESQAKMISGKFLILFIVVALLIFVHQSDAWPLRRRRRSCPVRNCQVSSWSSWSSCSASECGQQGSQSRSRQQESAASCGGAQCPDLHETRQCYGNTPRDCQVGSWSNWSSCSASKCGQHGSQNRTRREESAASCGGAQCPNLHETRLCYANKRVDCQLSSWSEWSACTVPCGVSGTQFSSRHKIVTEQCGGTCTSTFRKTRACPHLSCLNGGSLKDGSCFCNEGYSGNCCEKKVDEPPDKRVNMNCQLSSWSEWGSCTTPCGVSGSQTSSRHRTAMEQFGGTCTSTFRKTRACLTQSGCLNGGTLQHGACSCKEGYSGHCCEVGSPKHLFRKIFPPAMGVLLIFGAIVVYRKCKDKIPCACGE